MVVGVYDIGCLITSWPTGNRAEQQQEGDRAKQSPQGHISVTYLFQLDSTPEVSRTSKNSVTAYEPCVENT